MSRLAKARKTVVVPAVPGVSARPAEVLCPLPPTGRDYVVRNGQYRLAAINTVPTVNLGDVPPSCYILQVNNQFYRVCGSPFPTVTLIGG